MCLVHNGDYIPEKILHIILDRERGKIRLDRAAVRGTLRFGKEKRKYGQFGWQRQARTNIGPVW